MTSEQLVKLQACLEAIKSCLTSNSLLNLNKTEVVVFGPKLLGHRSDDHIVLNGISLACSLSVGNQGVSFDRNHLTHILYKECHLSDVQSSCICYFQAGLL